MTLTTKKSPITIDRTKIEPSAMPFLLSGTTMYRMISRRLAPASTRRLDGALVDPRHGVEDRHDHEDRELVHIGDHHREVENSRNSSG